MGTMPMGKAGVDYDEVCLLVRAYAERLTAENMSYSDLLANIDRLSALGQQARKLWGDR
jgi:hypothetical protein